MSLKDWERDVLNRQRNIVFPDTNLNEGRYYRNIASGKAIYTLGQKISLLIIVGLVIFVTSWGLADAIAEFLRSGRAIPALWGFVYLLAILLFWVFLAVKGLMPAARVRKSRGGYRRSGRV